MSDIISEKANKGNKRNKIGVINLKNKYIKSNYNFHGNKM